MTKSFEPIPPSQLFRTLLLHMIETHNAITPLVRFTTSRELKLCHMQNAYMLSEIESWLMELPEDTDLTPSLSAAQVAELRVGLVLSLRADEHPGGASPASAPPVRKAPRHTTPQAAFSRSAEFIAQGLAQNSNGRTVFRQQSSSAKPSCISPGLPPDTGTGMQSPASSD